MYDVIIEGGSVVDGTGAPARTADVAVLDGTIAAVGRNLGPARRVIAADGAVVAPGWIDIHTHYDGQVAWDDQLIGSSANGVTTVVTGNCGVGFAPVPRGQQDAMIDLMEGVEDIPGTALHEGIPWGAWESFEDYLDYLDTRQWTIDVATQLPHGSLRYFVMRDRALADVAATDAEVAEMARLTEAAMRAGAVGFSTSRIQQHRGISGRVVPGTSAPETELLAIATAMARTRSRVFQGIAADSITRKPTLPPEHSDLLDELAMFSRLSRATQLNVVFTLLQTPEEPDRWRDVLDLVAHENADGAKLRPCVAPRGVSMLTCLEGYHMFMRRPTYQRLKHLDAAGQARAMRDPETRRAILDEADTVNPDLDAVSDAIVTVLGNRLGSTFAMQAPIDYEPEPGMSVEQRALRAGRSPAEMMYDTLIEDEGRGFGLILANNYIGGNLDVCREMLVDQHTVTGLSDAGAHVRFVCDMSLPTFHVTHWARDRRRGATVPLETAIAKQSGVNAALYGFDDRGLITPGRRADLNVIDLDRLAIDPPSMLHDLPAGGRRIVQTASGYLATLVNGVVAREDDVGTGARPGRLVRAGR
jgi:N-acyl-D-aspartate/D-glutamate deacylase